MRLGSSRIPGSISKAPGAATARFVNTEALAMMQYQSISYKVTNNT
jgi:hypothetical protein